MKELIESAKGNKEVAIALAGVAIIYAMGKNIVDIIKAGKESGAKKMRNNIKCGPVKFNNEVEY